MDEYKKYAQLYDYVVGPFLQTTHKDMVTSLVEHGCTTVLDLCCGTGQFAGKARQEGLQPTGLDLSPYMLTVARNKFPTLDFIEQDASSLTTGDCSYDAVTISFALHEKRREIALAIISEALRVVKREGLIIIADYRIPSKRRSFSTGYVIELVEYMAGKEHYANFKEYMRCGGSELFLLEAGLNALRYKTHMGGWAGLFVHMKKE